MCSNKVKRQAEENRIRLFLAHRPDLLTQTLEHGDDGTEPDFKVNDVAGRLFGIELTELFVDEGVHGSALKMQETLRARLIADLRAALPQQGLYVTLIFNDGHPIQARNVRALVATIRGLIADAVHSSSSDVEVQTGHLPNELLHLKVRRFAIPTYIADPCAAFMPCWQPDQVQLRIDAKNAKRGNYTTSFDETWLCLFIEGRRFSSVAEVDEQLLAHAYASAFDRTVLFTIFENRVQQLHTKK